MVLTSVLQTASVAVQDLIDVLCPLGGRSATSLFTMVIAASGEGKTSVTKSSNLGIARFESEKQIDIDDMVNQQAANQILWKESIRAAQKELKSALKSGDQEKSIELSKKIADLESAQKIKNVAPQIRYQNVTIIKMLRDMANGVRNVYLASSEGGTILGEKDVNELPYFNDLWSGEPIFINRYRESFKVVDARLCIGIMVQKKLLERFMRRGNEEPLASGFLARFLITEPESTIGSRTKPLSAEQNAINDDFIQKFSDRVYQLLCNAANRKKSGRLVISLSPAAENTWSDYRKKIELHMGRGKALSDITDFASKLCDNICRIAAILHFFEGNTGPIQIDSMQLAIAIGENYLLEYKRLIGAYSPNEQLELDAHAIHQWLFNEYNKNPTRRYTRTQILQLISPKGLRNKARLDAAFDLLCNKGIAQRTPGPNSTPYMTLRSASDFNPNGRPREPGPNPVKMLSPPNWNELLGLHVNTMTTSSHGDQLTESDAYGQRM